MSKDKRKSRRRPMRYTAWVVMEGGELHGCALSDISESGARLDIDDTATIPDNFILLLTTNGKARRPCRVVWRKPHQIGVTFERIAVNGDKASLVPKLDSHMDSEPAEYVAANAEPAETK